MGAIRGGLFVIASVLLFVMLLAGGAVMTLSTSLEYSNIHEEIAPAVTEIINEQINLPEQIEDGLPRMEEYCENNSEFVFSEQGYTVDLPCEVIAQGKDAIVEEAIDDAIDSVYYKDYGCVFWDCFGKTETPFFLVSEIAQNYWANKFYLAILISLALFVGMFFLAEKKSNSFIVGGILMVVASLPFVKIDSVLLWFFVDENYLNIFSALFGGATTVFVSMLIFGIILLGVGILMKMFGFGFWLNKKFGGSGEKVIEKTVVVEKK